MTNDIFEDVGTGGQYKSTQSEIQTNLREAPTADSLSIVLLSAIQSPLATVTSPNCRFAGFIVLEGLNVCCAGVKVLRSTDCSYW
jgi:hypothetical protein